MKDYVEHVHRYSTRQQQRLQKICAPLEALGISTFWYDTMSTDGYFSCLGNQGPQGEFFADSGLFKGHPGFRHPDLATYSVEFPDRLYGIDQKYEDTQGQIRKKYGNDHTLFIRERQVNILHVYGFQSKVENFSMTSVYVNHLPLLKKFIEYFKKEAADLIKKSHEDKVLIAPACGADFFRKLETDKTALSKKQIDMFLRQIEDEPPSLVTLESFTQRERDCIQGLLAGLSAREMADRLGLSPRTTEHHIENIKNKIGCSKKSELIDKLLLLQPFLK